MNAILDVTIKPSATTMRLAVLAAIVEEVGTSTKPYGRCPVIAMAAQILESLGLHQAGWTMAEIAALTGSTEPAIRSVEKKAMRKLQHVLRGCRDGIVGDLRTMDALRSEREATLPEGME